MDEFKSLNGSLECKKGTLKMICLVRSSEKKLC